MLKNSVAINIIIDGREHKSGIIKPLKNIINVTARIRQLFIGNYQVDKRLWSQIQSRFPLLLQLVSEARGSHG